MNFKDKKHRNPSGKSVLFKAIISKNTLKYFPSTSFHVIISLLEFMRGVKPMIGNKKLLPIGQDDFRIIRESEKESYYVDKTLMVKDFLDLGFYVTLITRPRRFGKTLNMTMMRDFFDIEQQSDEIFKDLAIMDTEYGKRINTRPVVFLSFKGCTGKTVEDVEAAVAEEIFSEYKKHSKYLSGVDQEDVAYRRFFQTFKILDCTDGEEKERSKKIQNNITFLTRSLVYLTEALHTFYQIRPIVLIDEYDAPIIEAHQLGFREAFTSFYASLLTNTLKGNPHVGQALLTGIQRVAKESIFSKLNNPVVCTVLSEQYAPYFGLTEKETSTLLEHYDLVLNDEVKAYYDGYSFAGIDIYNPWSILNYANEKILKPYWLKTSTNALIKESVLAANRLFHRKFEKLIECGEAKVNANLEASFAELPQMSTLWGLFVNAGYLTVTHVDYQLKSFTVRIPNEEIVDEFREIVCAHTRLPSELLNSMLSALTQGEIEEFFEIYEQLVLESTSYHDSKENAYHMLFLGMVIHLRDLYDITSNIESGHGRSDIILKSKRASHPHLVIEFKQGEDVEKLKHEALTQIKKNKYYTGLTGDILLIGLAHEKKRCELVHELLTV